MLRNMLLCVSLLLTLRPTQILVVRQPQTEPLLRSAPCDLLCLCVVQGSQIPGFAAPTWMSPAHRCLQPGEWESVKQRTPMPRNYTALVVVREPIQRFVAALTEVMQRVFKGECPEGPCTAEHDHYFTDGEHDAADIFANRTSWYYRALQMYHGRASRPEQRQQAVRELLAAAVTDASCNIAYWSAEHFLSQSVLAMQAHTTPRVEPHEHLAASE